MLVGHFGEDAVLVARRGARFFAVGATCTHYSGPLNEGVLVNDTVRCPLHHACFSLRTGEVLRAPALSPIPCYDIKHELGMIYVTGKRTQTVSTPSIRTLSPKTPPQIVIVGAGAAGAAAALTLRQEGYPGRITMIGAEAVEPYDRPNLSKDYLAGNAPEDWLPLKPREIRMELGSPVTRLDPKLKTLSLENGRSFNFDALLLATGASPVRLNLPGAEQPHVHYLRSLTDCRAIIASTGSARNAVVIGASFIGLEVAASLRARDIAVRVVAPDSRPLERVFGPELGAHIQKLHEDKGVIFHLGRTTASIAEKTVTLDDGSVHPADLVVIGVGVRPATALAERAGVVINQGVQVDQFLETSLPGVFAAGDIARWPDPHTGGHIRVEHWVVAERQGQTAARNILGAREPFDAVPFFWSQHYDTKINYVGHAERWDGIERHHGLPQGGWEERYMAGGVPLAVATIGRDRESLEAEHRLEHLRVPRQAAQTGRAAVPAQEPQP
jgi:NADPH-dependent 2,4-dienoyl-CoA reductase/sulfur reductase-like enzyme/nitrite reductase/ring-hydroxylating ferredoxin subunit